MKKFNFDELPDPENRFILDPNPLGVGVYGKVVSAIDTQASNRKVAIKIQRLNRDTIPIIQEEHRVYQEIGSHPNLLDFLGCFRKVGEEDDEVWFVLELCEGGPVIDLVRDFVGKNRRMTEEHIAFIIKEVIKALVHMHEHRIIHRDVKAANILLTKEGDVKLCDFGLSRHLASTLGKSDTCLGSPCWMAPEVVANGGSPDQEDDDMGYGNRVDVWALGITAIEMGDGKAPFQEMHPTRALFQIVRNPPPTLYRPSNWSDSFNDFISECLVKNPEHRPYSMELLEHPFLIDVPENNYHLTQEIKYLLSNKNDTCHKDRYAETIVQRHLLKQGRNQPPVRMLVEDLAALDRISEEAVLQELQARMQSDGNFQTFIGDILFVLNPNEERDIYNDTYHKKYNCQSRSANPPHIYAVADAAYQDAIHHAAPQNILISGESGSGKTTSFLHLVDHLLYLSENMYVSGERIKNAIRLVHALTHSSTPLNPNSTRCVLRTDITFGRTGKLSGAIFNMWQLDKWRVSSMGMSQANFHIFYYFYDGLQQADFLDKYLLSSNRQYRYMRIPDEVSKKIPRDTASDNVKKYQLLTETMTQFELGEDMIDTIHCVIAAVLNLGDVRFKQLDQNMAEVENEDISDRVATLLSVDHKKFNWSLTNYCLINRGTAFRRHHTALEAREARDVLANTLYNRLVDYIVNVINNKLAYGRTIFGERYVVKILDLYGFECFRRNQLPQLFVNTINEQLHYHFTQRMFAWETLELTEQDVPHIFHHYCDNKSTLDQLLGKPAGLLHIIDDASKMGHGAQYIIDFVRTHAKENINHVDNLEFSVAHFTGKVTYDAKEMAEHNRDFLPPEVIEVLRLSKNKIIRSFFADKLTRTGNLYTSFDDEVLKKKSTRSLKILSSSSDEDVLNKPTSDIQYSQIKKMRTTISTLRGLCLELMKELSACSGGAGGMHFVRCARSDLDVNAKGFHTEIVRQQIRALAIVESAKARQKGYPYRVSFSEFLKRYKFLAFDFNETVEISKENCRLLLVRLKMEGWMIGKSKVFLRYYNEEYLARLYEVKVKKIVKIQSLMRGFFVKRNLAKKNKAASSKLKEKSIEPDKSADRLTEDGAARILQKAYRGVANRKASKFDTGKEMDEDTKRFIRFFYNKWRAKSIFQVLLQYRAARFQDMFHLSQQVHIFNAIVVNQLNSLKPVNLDEVDRKATVASWIGEEPSPTVTKLYFNLLDIPFFDTSYMCDPFTNTSTAIKNEENWDSPFRMKDRTVSAQMVSSMSNAMNPLKAPPKDNQYLHAMPTPISNEKLINLPYNRDPNESIRRLSSVLVEPEPDLRSRSRNEAPIPTPPPMPQQEQCKFQHNSYNKNLIQFIPKFNITSGNNVDIIKPLQLKNNSTFKQMYNDCNPISELKSISMRQLNDGDNDDESPPYNFKGILKKTNYNRESIRRDPDDFHGNASLNQMKDYRSLDDISERQERFIMKSRTISTELAPGIHIEGTVTDL